jgi:hypothetical protein
MDLYKHRLKRAQYSWLEGKVCPYHISPRKKDRVSGRDEKRGARNKDRADMRREVGLCGVSPSMFW